MKQSELETLSVRMVKEYYEKKYGLFYGLMDDDILWLGPRTGQMIRGKKALKEIFRTYNITDTTFHLGPVEANLIPVSRTVCEVVLHYGVFTIFPDGETHMHSQRLHLTWCLRAVKDGSSGGEYRILLMNIANCENMEGMTISALSAEESVKDALKQLRKPVVQTRVAFRDDEGSDYYIPATEILYIESSASGRKSIVHTTLKTIGSKERLSDFETRYPKQFLHAHTSFLVNPMFVRSVIHHGVQLINGEEIPVPEKKFTGFKKALREWMPSNL
jgi:hypothetical protein